ncbi:MAG: cadherin-like domain-containing protein [Comamonas sp.]|nr:cadherin-like domain-containing protein [Comamonas sp.]
MATSIQNPSNTNIIVNEWTNVYSAGPVAGFTGTVRIVVEVGSGTTIKLANSSTGVNAITQGYGNLYNGSATSIAFEGTQDQVNAALQSLQAFNSNAAGSGTLRISAVKAGSAYNPDNGHYYQAIYSSGGIGWQEAKAAAASASLKFNGLQGYLATITSAKENEFILNKLPADAWIGATDKDMEGRWKWDTGPEAGQEFWYWNGSTGVTVSSRYHNWNSNEPNNSTNHSGSSEGEDYGQFYVSGGSPGKWNDLPGAGAAAGKLKYYVVEYGSMAGDTPTEAAASSSSTLTVQARPVITSNGGGTTASINYAENGTAAVTTVTASDDDSGDSQTYSIAGGADANSFNINSANGVLTFKTSPNFETPTDSDANNSYQVTVRVTDGVFNGQTRYDEQTLTINVTNVNDLPTTSGSLPTSIATTEEATVDVDLSALGFSDQDPSDTFILKLAASEGTLAANGANGVAVAGSGSDTLTLTGTPAAVSAYLDTANRIQYTGALNDNGSPAANIAVSYKDSAMGSYLPLGSAINVNITAVNDAPVITSDTTKVSLPAIREDETSATNPGATVNSLFGTRFTDVDSGATMSGIVVVGNASTSTEGAWEYSTDSGASWHAIGAVSATAGLVLSTTTQLRFAPAANWNGTPGELSVKLLDNTQASFTSGSTKVTFDTTVNTASSAASTNAVSLTTSVAAVNDLPKFDSAAGAASLTETAALDSSVTTDSGALTGTLAVSDVEDGTDVTYGIRGGTATTNAGVTTITKSGFFGTLELNTSTKVWTYTPSNFTAINALNHGQTATDVFDFSITDSAGATASQGLTITYTGTNDTPVVKAGLDPIPDQTFNGNGSWSYQIPADIFTDADGTNLTYTVQVVDGSGNVIDTITNATGADATKPSNWLIFNEGSRTLSGEPTATAPLPLNIKITASDGTGSVSDTFTVTLVQPNSDENPDPGAVTAPNPDTTLPGLAIAGNAAYTENAAPKALAPALAIAYSDSLTLASAKVFISEGKVDGDLLAFANPNSSNPSSTYGNILATYNATNGLLILASASNSATLAQWEAALKAVTFYSSSDNPGNSRTLLWQVNDGANFSNIGTTSIAVTPVNDAPVATKLSDVTHASNALWELDVDGTGNNLFTDAEAETITYSATLADGSDLPSWLSFNAATHTFSGNPPAGLPYLNLKVIGTDASGAAGETTFTLNLTDTANGAAAANTTGTVSISGTPALNATLTAAIPTDADGLTGTVTYQWQKSSDGNNWSDIGNATSNTFTVTQAESKQQLRVQAFYNDDGGFAEDPVSNALTVPALNLAGKVEINGATQPGATLVASLSDSNGLFGVTPTYQWYRGDSSGAQTTSIGGNFSSYTLTTEDGGKFVTVKVTYTDNEGTAETVTGTSTQIQLGAMPPEAVNDTGTATEAGGDPGTGGSNASGNVLDNDTDLNPSDTKTVTGLRTGDQEGLGEAGVLEANGTYTVAGTYGTLTITAADGAYTYAVNQSAANVQALKVGQNVTDAFNYTVTDGTSKSDIGVLTITLNGTNDAPVLQNGTDSAPALTTITEDATDDANNPGSLISALVRAVDGTNPTDNTKSVVTDVDTSGGMGVAIYATANNGPADGGKWQYKIGSGTWTDVSTVSESGALLLASTDSIRFVPDEKNGTTATFSYYLWDGSSGAAGSPADVSDAKRGGSSAFSTAGDVATITVTDVNDAPTLDLDASAGGTSFTTTFRPRGAAVAVVDSDVTIADVDKLASDNVDYLTGATVSLSAGAVDNLFGTTFETLSFKTGGASGTDAVTYTGSQGAITIAGNGGTTLSLTGKGTWADYQTALQSVYYINSNPNAATGERTVTVTVTDGALTVGEAVGDRVASTSATATVQTPWTTVVDLNGSATGRDHSATYTEDSPGVAVAAPTASLDNQAVNIKTVKLELGTAPDTTAEKLFVSTDLVTLLNGRGITVTGNDSQTLTLSANDPANGVSAENMQLGLRAVQYVNSSQNPTVGNRAVTVSVADVQNAGVSAKTILAVVPMNDAPVIGGDRAATIAEGGSYLFTTTDLNPTDVDDDPSTLIYRISTIDTKGATTNGTLFRDANRNNEIDAGEKIGLGATFTQADVASGLIKYQHGGDDNTADAFGFQLEDGLENGVTAPQATFSLTVTPTNDAPTLTTASTATAVAFSEADGTAVNLFSGAAVGTGDTTGDPQSIQQLVLTVTGVADGLDEKLKVNNVEIALVATNTTAMNTGSPTVAGLSYAVSVTGGTATVTLSHAGLSTAQAEALVNTLAYRNSSNAPTTTHRVITLTRIQDSGGTADGGIDSASLEIARTVTITAEDSAPVLATNLGITLSDGATATLGTAQLNTTDSDSATTALTYTITAATGQGTLFRDIDGNGHADAGEVLGVNSTFTQQDLIGNQIKYLHTGSLGADSFQFTVADATTLLTEATFAITVNAAGAAPGVSGGGTTTASTSGGARLFPDVTVRPPEGNTVQSLSFTVTGVQDGNQETLNIHGQQLAMAATTAPNHFFGTDGNQYIVKENSTGSFTVTVVDTAAPGFTGPQAEALIESVTLSNAAVPPTPGTRKVTLDSVVNQAADGTATTTDAPNITSVVNINTAIQPFTMPAPDVPTPPAGSTIQTLSFSVTGVQDGASEVLKINGQDIPLVPGTTTIDGILYTVAVDGSGNATVSVTDPTAPGWSETDAETLLGNITYVNNATPPTSGERGISLTSVTPVDGTGTAGTPQTVSGQGTTVSPTNGAATTPMAGDALPDIADTSTVDSLTFQVTGVKDGNKEVLTFGTTAVPLVPGSVSTAGGVTPAGTYAVTVVNGTATVVFTPTTNLTEADATALTHSTQYTNTKAPPTGGTREVSLASMQVEAAGGGTSTVSTPNVGSKVLVSPNGSTVPTISGDTAFDVDEGATYTLTTADIDATDSQLAATSLVYKLTSAPGQGQLFRDGNNNGLVNSGEALALNSTFTQAELSAGTIKYRHGGNEPAAESFALSVSNGQATTAPASVTVTVNQANDAPTLSLTAATNPSFTEGGSAATLFSSATASTVEDGQKFTQIKLTVAGVRDATEQLVVDGVTVALTHDTSGTTSANTVGYSVSVTGTTASVTLTHAGATAAQVQSLLTGLAYRNSSDNPTVGTRTIAVTGLTDNGGTDNGGRDSIALNLSSQVTVGASNSAPTLAGDSAITVLEGGSQALTTTDLIGADADTPLSALVYRLTAAPTQGTLFRDLNGNTIHDAGDVTLAAGGTFSHAELLTGKVRYVHDGSESGDSFAIQVNDGALDATAAKTITVTRTPVNDAPVIAHLGSDTMTYPAHEGTLTYRALDVTTSAAAGTPSSGAPNAVVTDVDSTDFANGSLRVSVIFNNNPAADSLRIFNTTGGITTDTTKVYSNGIEIGTYSGGSGTSDLVVTFNSAVTPAVAQALLQSIQFANSETAPALNSRTVRFVLTDGDGGSAQADVNVNIQSNLKPSILNGSGFFIAENTSLVTVLTAENPPGVTGSIAYTISDSTAANNADAALFQVNASNGTLSFKAAPDYETSKDAGTNNVYNVVVRATSSTLNTYTESALTVNVVDVATETVVAGDTAGPAFGFATVNGTSLVLAYTDASNLDATNTPPASAFSVSGNTVTAVAVNATAKTVTLTLANAVVAGQAVTVTYTDPSADNDTLALQDAAGNDAATLASTAVTNVTPSSGGGSTGGSTGGGSTGGGGTTGGGATGGGSTGGSTGGGSTGGGSTGGGGTTGGGATGGGGTTGGETGTGTGTTGGGTSTPTPTPGVTTIDGTSVATSVTSQTGNNGASVTVVSQTIAPVSTTRQEDSTTSNDTLADIPLLVSGGNTLLSIGLPVGVGAITTNTVGATTLSVREQLIAASEPRVDDSTQMQAILERGIDRYTSQLSSEGEVTVRTITLTSGTGLATPPAQAIVISGATGTGELDPLNPNRQEALVIDARALPPGTALKLEKVEFAVVIGPARLEGGEGQNFVVGDGYDQYIVLGPEDDELHGGAGNDTVGSGSGNDVLYGDAGDDVLFGGAGNDVVDGGTGHDTLRLSGSFHEYHVEYAFDRGRFTFADTVALRDDIDTVTAVENFAFSSGAVSNDALVSLLQPTLTAQAQVTALQNGMLQSVGSGAGDDVYLISGALLGQGSNVTITDTQGANRIQLADGLSITSSEVANTALRLTLNSGATVTVLDAHQFTYDVGMNLTAKVGSMDFSFAEFTTGVLGAKQSASGNLQGGAVTIGGQAGQVGQALGNTSAVNNLLLPQPGSAKYVGSGQGDDTYLLSAGTLQAGTAVTLTDVLGKNSIQLAAGLQIASSIVAQDALQLTFANGATVTVLGASAFTFDVGGNLTAGIDNPDVSFKTLVEDTLGAAWPVSAAPTARTYAGAVVVGVADNGTPVAVADL